MATTKKTVKKGDATDKKKTTTSKNTTTAKKKTGVKKDVENTGVVDEFLNTVVGTTITEEEAEKQTELKKKKTADKKNAKKSKVDVSDPELTDVSSAEIPEKVERPLDIVEKETINTFTEVEDKSYDEQCKEVEELNEMLEKNGLVGDLNSDIRIDENLTEIYNQQAAKLSVEMEMGSKGKIGIPITAPYLEVKNEELKPVEKEKAPTVDDLRVNLQTTPEQSFTYVNSFMGVKYD